MENAKVYSYLRFSDPRQAMGSSVERQLEYARRWAAERALSLDESLTLRDEGLSAYHERHVKQGALGVFLRAVSDNLIAPGSVLIVEGLDRLSRAEPIQAQAQLAQIINAGITVVTASDGREYNRATLKAQPMDLVYSLLVMIRAHEESDTKSKRVKASIRRLCEGWISGTYRGLVRNGKDPAWLRWDSSTAAWLEIPERVEAVRAILFLYGEGQGSVRLIDELRRRDLRYTDGPISTLQLYRLVRLRSLVGEKEIDVDGLTYRLQGYYPALLTYAEFDELQLLVERRKKRKVAGEFPGIFTGQAMCYCGYCGGAMVAQNLLQRKRKADGSPQDGHRRIQCCVDQQQRTCPVSGSCSIVPLERALMAYCADQFNLAGLFGAGDRAAPLRARLQNEEAQEREIVRQLDRVTDALVETGSALAAPAVFVRKARELEEALATVRAGLESTRRELASISRVVSPDLSAAWGQLTVGVHALDSASRLKARKLVSDTFERIVIYHRGIVPVVGESARAGNIDMLLIARGGVSRLLRVDRRTGAWHGGQEDFTGELV